MAVRLTDREMDIMAVLWKMEEATAADIRSRLHEQIAHTTVLTMLSVMEAKGYVCRIEGQRAHRFRPVIDPADAGDTILTRLIDKVFSGSAELLVMHLLKDRKLDREELEQLRTELESQLGEEQ